MGGFGSGRQSSRSKLEDGLRLDLNKLLRKGQIRKHSWSRGTLTWSYVYSGEDAASIIYESSLINPQDQWLRLSYTLSRHGDKIPMDYKIRIISTNTNFGGSRLWFECPRTRKRATVLYCVYGCDYFYSRHAFRALYRSQSKSPYDRAIDKMWKLKNRMGGEVFWQKPRGMHERTFQRKLEEILDAEEICDAYLGQFLMQKLGALEGLL